jgi:hypothetical protein
MRLTLICAVIGFALFGAGCANRTGDQTIAQYCADGAHQNTDICKQHGDTEEVRMSLGERIASVLGIATHAQETADQAMARNVVCVTRTLHRTSTGSCDPGYSIASCTQTRYTSSAGGMAILRSVSDSECRFNSRALEVQVRCCTMGPNPPPATQVSTQPAPPMTPAPMPTS